MAISDRIEYIPLDSLFLDPKNPRLGRSFTERNPDQAAVLAEVRKWNLDELGWSFVESGFWIQEALIVVNETLDGKPREVVVEGNRRLGALRLLRDAFAGRAISQVWARMTANRDPSRIPFEAVPCVRADSRQDVLAFLGFRHVTGIAEWPATQKAEYIADLIENHGWTYEQVRERIGSKTPTVRQTYIAYRLLKQLAQHSDVPIEKVEDRFSVLYLSVRSEGTQRFLGLNEQADPAQAKEPVPEDHLSNLVQYAHWLFGPSRIVSDSRQIDEFGEILGSEPAVDYLRAASKPDLTVAYRIAGGERNQFIALVSKALESINEARELASVSYASDSDVLAALERLRVAVNSLIGMVERPPANATQ